jgi:ComF family protein
MALAHRIPVLAQQAGRAALDLVFPPRCLLCMIPLDGSTRRFCERCWRRLSADRGKLACPRCAANVALYEVTKDQCGHCRGRRPHVMRMVRVGPYGDLLGHLLRRYKYNDRTELAPVLGEWLAEAVAGAPWLDRIDALTFVPSHWTRRMLRPSHPAEELARMVGGRVNLPAVNLLRRTRARPHQVGLTHAQRVVNVRGMYAVRPGVRLEGPTLLLIDDVRTTGATLNECAKRLRRAGAKEIYGAVVVSASPYRLSDPMRGAI